MTSIDAAQCQLVAMQQHQHQHQRKQNQVVLMYEPPKLLCSKKKTDETSKPLCIPYINKDKKTSAGYTRGNLRHFSGKYPRSHGKRIKNDRGTSMMFLRIAKLTIWKSVERVGLRIVAEGSTLYTIGFLRIKRRILEQACKGQNADNQNNGREGRELTGSRAYSIPRGTSRSATSSRRRPTKYARRTRAIDR